MTNCHEKLRQYRKWGLERAVIGDTEMDALVAEFDQLKAELEEAKAKQGIGFLFGLGPKGAGWMIG